MKDPAAVSRPGGKKSLLPTHALNIPAALNKAPQLARRTLVRRCDGVTLRLEADISLDRVPAGDPSANARITVNP
ncbi:hypothetical protein GCM10027402_06500 [Arthrobacter monumenti]